MKKIIAITLASIFWSTANAGFSYDSKSGNSYNTIGSSTYGHNSRTGSSWSSHNSGSYSYGTDKSGNSWSYDRNSGAYRNSNGKSCFGKGALRSCN